jgi:hypothetical protein
MPVIEGWLLRVCRVCKAALGGTRAAIALKRCPECGAPTIPVEDATRAVPVVPDNGAYGT